MTTKKAKWGKRLLFVFFVLLNVGIILWTATSEFKDGGNAAKLSDVRIKWWLIIPAALMFAVAVLAGTYKFLLLMRETRSMPEGMDKKEAWKVARRTLFLGRYYDNLTPASVGGQPFQIYYMHKNGIKNGYSAVMPMIVMITDQLGFLIMALIALPLGSMLNSIWSPAVVMMGWVGLLVFAFFPLAVLGATFLPAATNAVIKFGVSALSKMHIVKDREETTEKAIAGMKQYADGIKTIFRQKGLFWKEIGLGALYYAGIMMVPFFVLMAFGTNVGLFACFATTVAVSAAIYFVPTPGNAGAAEGLFYSVFSVLPEAGYVFWAMLIWRFFVYYMWLIIGGITQVRIYAKDKSLRRGWKKGVDKFEDVAEKVAKSAAEEVEKNK